jgi:DNA-binding NarL/FixJ family response regulator
MGHAVPNCAILAIRHLELAEGMRGLLETSFATVYVVADAESLVEGVQQLAPTLVAVDLALAGGDIIRLLARLRAASASSRQVVLSAHDDAAAARLALAAGANAVVLKRTIGSDLLDAVDTVIHGGTYVSPAFGLEKGPAAGQQSDLAASQVTRAR